MAADAGVDPVGVARPTDSAREFGRILAAQVGSTFGSQLAFVATPLAAYLLTGSAAAAGIVGVFNAITRTVTALFGGVLADRRNQRSVMLVCDLARAVANLLLVVLILRRVGGLGAFCLLITVEGFFSALFTPSQTVAVRRITPPELLVTRLARSESASWAAALAGPPLGGLLFTLNPAWPFAGNAVSYLFSAWCLSRLRTSFAVRGAAPGSTAEPARGAPRPAELLAGLRYVAHDRFLRAVVAQIALHNIALGALSIIVVVGATQRGVADAAIGVLVAAQALGALVGGLCAGAALRRIRAGRVVLLTGWTWVALMPLIAATHDWALQAGLLALLWFLAPVQRTVVGTYQGQTVPDGLLGRVSSAVLLLSGALAAVGPGVGGGLLHVGALPLTVGVLVAVTLPPLVFSTFVARIGGVTVEPARSPARPRPDASSPGAAGGHPAADVT